MASDSDPRLKPNRTSRLSKTQMTALGLLCFVIIVSMATYYSEVLWEIEHVKKAHAYVSTQVQAANQFAYTVGDSVHNTPVMQGLNGAAYNLGTAVTGAATWAGSGMNSWANSAWSYYGEDSYQYQDYRDEYSMYAWDDVFDDQNPYREADLGWWGNPYGGDVEDSYFVQDYSYFDNGGLFPDYFTNEEDAAEFFQWSKDWQAGNEQSQFHDLAFFDDREFNDWDEYDFDYEELFWGEENQYGSEWDPRAWQGPNDVYDWRRHSHRRRGLAEATLDAGASHLEQPRRRAAHRKVLA